MKLIDFMKSCVKFYGQGYQVVGNGDVVVIFGLRGKVVIKYGEIYNWSFSRLKEEVRALKPLKSIEGDKDGTGNGEARSDAGGDRGDTASDGAGGGSASVDALPAEACEGKHSEAG